MVEENKQILLSSLCCLCLEPETQVALSTNIDTIHQYADVVKMFLECEQIEMNNISFSVCFECATKLKLINDFRKRSTSSYTTMVNFFHSNVVTLTEEKLDKIKEDQDKDLNGQNKIKPKVTSTVHIDESSSTPDNEGKQSPKKINAAVVLSPEQEERKKLFNPYVSVTNIGLSHTNKNKYLESTKSEFETEQNTTHQRRDFIRKTVYEIFHNGSQLKHQRKPNFQMLQCEHCKRKFMNPSSLMFHKKLEHSKEVVDIDCPNCGIKFDDLNNYTNHMNRVHLNKYNCLKCRRKFLTQKSLDRHLNKKHNNMEEAT